jgi:hypothetical protein
MSVHGHSSAIAAKNYVIFCLDDESPAARSAFQHWLTYQRIGFKPLLGMWHGKAEFPFIVSLRDWAVVKDTGLVDKQECFLHLGACDRADRREAWLEWRENWEHLGHFGEVTEEEAKAEGNEGWTYDPSTLTYFLAKRDWSEKPTHCPACHQPIVTGADRARFPTAIDGLLS